MSVRPAPRFRLGDTILPGPDSTLSPQPGTTGTVIGVCGDAYGWHYHVEFLDDIMSLREKDMLPAFATARREFDAAKAKADDGRLSGWQGTEPAEGTRRALIRGAILEAITEYPGAFDVASRLQQSSKLADAVESALLKQTIDQEAMARGAEAMTDGIVSVDPTEPVGTEETADDAARRFAGELIEVRENADRLLEEREQARAGEDSFKAQRDAALNLLRWLIGGLLPSPASFPPGGPDPDQLSDALAGIEDRLCEIRDGVRDGVRG